MKNKDLYKKIINVSNIIARNQRESNANFMITSPEIAESIKMLDIKYQRKKKLEKLKCIENENNNKEKN